MARESVPRFEVQLGTFGSTIASVSDAEGASMLAEAIRQRGLAAVVEWASDGDPMLPARRRTPVIVIDGRIGGNEGLELPEAFAGTGRVVFDLTARDAATDAVIDAQTVSMPCSGSPTAADACGAVRRAVRSAIEEAVTRLFGRLRPEWNAGRRDPRRRSRA